MKTLLLIISVFTTLIGIPSAADVLVAPIKIPFAKDVPIKKFNKENSIELFIVKSGRWNIEKTRQLVKIVGNALNKPALLLSQDKLSSKPKSFKLDFDVVDTQKEFGFVYGNYGAIISQGFIYPAKFIPERKMLVTLDDKGSFTKINSTNNTFEINTGHDPLGGAKLGTTLYVNGTGVEVPHQKEDSIFGFLVQPRNTIRIYNFRWGIGST